MNASRRFTFGLLATTLLGGACFAHGCTRAGGVAATDPAYWSVGLSLSETSSEAWMPRVGETRRLSSFAYEYTDLKTMQQLTHPAVMEIDDRSDAAGVLDPQGQLQLTAPGGLIVSTSGGGVVARLLLAVRPAADIAQQVTVLNLGYEPESTAIIRTQADWKAQWDSWMGERALVLLPMAASDSATASLPIVDFAASSLVVIATKMNWTSAPVITRLDQGGARVKVVTPGSYGTHMVVRAMVPHTVAYAFMVPKLPEGAQVDLMGVPTN